MVCLSTVRTFEDRYNEVMNAFGSILDQAASAGCESLVEGEMRLNGGRIPSSRQTLGAQCPGLEVEIDEVRTRTSAP